MEGSNAYRRYKRKHRKKKKLRWPCISDENKRKKQHGKKIEPLEKPKQETRGDDEKTAKTSQPTIIMWNCHGFKNVMELDREEQKKIIQADIICLSETWLWKELEKGPIFLETYTCYNQLATKEKSLGRAKGGLAVYTKNELHTKLLEKNEWWIAIEFQIDKVKFVMIYAYFSPTQDIKIYLQEINELVTNTQNLYPNSKIIIGGDFNARIGELNNFSEKYEEEIFLGTPFSPQRNSLDIVTNRRGMQLVHTMEQLGLYVLNGRCRDDNPAQYTFLGTEGNKSIIDQVWANLEAMEDIDSFKSTDISLRSDHLPVQITLKPAKKTPRHLKRTVLPKKIPAIRWIPDNLASYQTQLSLSEIKHQEHENMTVESGIEEMITEAATEAKMLQLNKKIHPTDKPWYTSECREKKRNIGKAFRALRSGYYTQDLFSSYNEAKRDYKRLTEKLKREHYQEIQNKLAAVRNSEEFWSTIQKYKTRSRTKNPINMETWTTFLERMYKKDVHLELCLEETTNALLDQQISLSELETVLQKSKAGKAPGPDGLSNEFYKYATEETKNRILKMYNRILEEETIPSNWTNTKLCLIYKKGDPNLPENYRGISLLNNILKIFTNIMNNRLLGWEEENKIIPEEQFGFRKGRGCQDAIYTLYACIGINIRLKKRKVYAIFVDFQRAFDSIPHDPLWQKISKMGVSSKFIRTFKHLYDNASLTTQIDGENSNKIRIGKGVLQGEIASPMLFNLYISDIGNYLKNAGVRGVSLDGASDVSHILYADDLVILTDTQIMAQKALNALAEFCSKNHMKVNKKKTKVMVFRQGGRISPSTKFYYEDENLEIVQEFCYLGVLFSTKGTFRKAMERSLTKAGIATGSTKAIMVKSKLQAWEAREKMYKATITSTLLYAAETWSLRYLDQLEKAGCRYYKTLYNWPATTPNYMIRAETGTEPIACTALTRALKWLKKIKEMNSESLPKKCFLQLLHLDKKQSHNLTYNWVTQLRTILVNLDPNIPPLDILQTNEETLKSLSKKYRDKINLEDKDKIINSSYRPSYQLILTNEGTQDYLQDNVSFSIKKIISQLRVNGTMFVKLTANGNLYKWEQTKICQCCNLGEEETLEHFMWSCPLYDPLRNHLLTQYARGVTRDQMQVALLTNLNKKKMFDIAQYTTNALKLRSFSLNE